MNSLRVKHMSRISIRDCRVIFKNWPLIRKSVLSWYDGDSADLLERSSGHFLRRLVIRALREHGYSSIHCYHYCEVKPPIVNLIPRRELQNNSRLWIGR